MTEPEESAPVVYNYSFSNFWIILTYIGDLHTFSHPSDIVYFNLSKQSTPTMGHLQFRI